MLTEGQILGVAVSGLVSSVVALGSVARLLATRRTANGHKSPCKGLEVLVGDQKASEVKITEIMVKQGATDATIMMLVQSAQRTETNTEHLVRELITQRKNPQSKNPETEA